MASGGLCVTLSLIMRLQLFADNLDSVLKVPLPSPSLPSSLSLLHVKAV